MSYLKQASLPEFQQWLNSNGTDSEEVKHRLKQRHFYRSATSFYRSYSLFLAYLTLQRQYFGTWANVTGYYSRFYFIQAFLNLIQSSWFGSEDAIPAAELMDKQDRNFFAFNTGNEVRFLQKGQLITALGGTSNFGSHAIWWKIFGALGKLEDFPQIESLEFVLGDYYFNVDERNQVNYSHEYIQGFPELEWFDSDTNNMMAHFKGSQIHRADRDITDIDRFFEDYDPEYADPADFYSDEAQMLWCSVDCYLRVLGALEIEQGFITVEKLAALAQANIGDLLPKMHEGIVTAVTGTGIPAN